MGNGWTALMLLCIRYKHDNFIDIVRLLVDNGIQVDARGTDDGKTAIDILSERDFSDTSLAIEPVIQLLQAKIPKKLPE